MRIDNRIKKIIGFVFAWTLLVYLGVAFAQCSFDLSKMEVSSRAHISGLWLLIVIIVASFLYCCDED